MLAETGDVKVIFDHEREPYVQDNADGPLAWVYKFKATWRHKHDEPGHEHKYCNRDERGLCQNALHSGQAFREEQSDDEMRRIVLKWWGDYEKKGDNWTEAEITIRLHQRSEWWTEWFSSKTFDRGQSDEEALDGLMNYVMWAQRLPSIPTESGYPLDAITLMGAEDRWRWCGSKSGSGTGFVGLPDDDRTDPPCRCEGCKKNGVIVVNH